MERARGAPLRLDALRGALYQPHEEMSSTPRVPREGMRSPQRGAGLVTRSATAADSARCAAAAHTTRFAAPRALRFPPAARHATRGVHSGTLSFTSPPQPGPPLARVTKAAAGGCLPSHKRRGPRRAACTRRASTSGARRRGLLTSHLQAGRQTRTQAGRQAGAARARGYWSAAQGLSSLSLEWRARPHMFSSRTRHATRRGSPAAATGAVCRRAAPCARAGALLASSEAGLQQRCARDCSAPQHASTRTVTGLAESCLPLVAAR